MINFIWPALIIVSIIFALIFGKISPLSIGILVSSKEGIETCMTLLASMCMWSGMLKVADKAGLIDMLSNGIKPILKKLFITDNNESLKYISVNIIANMFGLGACATPSGLKAFKELNKENKDKKRLSHDMCMFLLINLSSVQLFSVNLIAYRVQYGSSDPNGVIIQGLIATTITTVVAIIYGLIKRRNAND